MMKTKFVITAQTAIFAALLVSCSPKPNERDGANPGTKIAASGMTIDKVDTAAIMNAQSTPDVWMSYGGTYDEQRFSKLTGITKDNIADLGVAWTYELKTDRGVEATPIVVDGVMYLTSAWSIVYALDAKTGEELWVYDPKVSGEDAAKGCCDVINRGVAVYEGKVYVGVFDGRLEALDAKTGEVLWSKVTVDQSKPYTITGAPRVVKGKVLIGNGGAELGVRGYISAYDADTGDMAWRFYTTPNPNKQPDGAASDDIMAKLANDTWGDDGAWTTDGGGGTVWDSIIYDTVNDSVIFGVGNSSPWKPELRDPNSDGDNVFISSIVAVDADTGEYKWHYQTTPRDQWDYTATQTLILANLPIGENGAERRVVMQAPKNGFFYVIDAKTGEFLSGNAYTPKISWASGIDENGRPIINPEARETSGAGFLAIPAPAGAHNWHPMAYSPNTGLAYIPSINATQVIQDAPENGTDKPRWNIGYNLAAGLPPTYPAGTTDFIKTTFSGGLIAWDPVKKETRWVVEQPEPFNGGILTTDSDVLFQGDVRGKFSAYDAETGERLWSRDVKSGVQAAPSTYAVDGEQYVAIATGWGGSYGLTWGLAWEESVAPDLGRVVAFKLGGQAEVPDAIEPYIQKTPKGKAFGSQEQVLFGFQRYSEHCMVCHGPLAIGSGVLPDLRWSITAAEKDFWDNVVLRGERTSKGMISFADNISEAESEAIRAYVMDQAWLAVKNGEAEAPAKP